MDEAIKLGVAIAEQAERAGVYNGEAPLDGPALLLLLQDMGDILADRHNLVRELDEALSGPGNAAKQASLCDLIPQAKAMREALRANSDALRKALTGGQVPAYEAAEALKQAAKWCS